MSLFQSLVNSGPDDGDRGASGLNNAGYNLYMGNNGGQPSHIFLRFTGIDIGGIINSSSITFTVVADSDITPCRIYGELAPNPSAPTTATDFDNRVMTTAYVDWSPSTWANGLVTTPDISSIIQELVDTFTYDGSQAIILYIKDNGSGTNLVRRVRAYDLNVSYAQQLDVDYTLSNQTPTIELNTSNDTLFQTSTPTLEMTGTDAETDDLTYDIKISDTPLFSSGENATVQLLSGSGTTIHTNPVSGTTWLGDPMVDDRPGTSFFGFGGILKRILFYFGPHETYPQDVDGYYKCRLYEAGGVHLESVPNTWTSLTSYLSGTYIRPVSSANGDVHIYYRCKTPGTSGSTEPTWPCTTGILWTTVPEGYEINDGSVVWEAVYPSYPLDLTDPLNPAMPADPADTPTPGWIAESDTYYYNPGSADLGWKTLYFSGQNQVRLDANKYYMVIIDWIPINNLITTNTLAIISADFEYATTQGNLYIDGPATSNNGGRIIGDLWIEVIVETILISKSSDTDSGFLNTITPSDFDPFISGEKISYTVQPIESLPDSEFFYTGRVNDVNGSGLWSEWSPPNSFFVEEVLILGQVFETSLSQPIEVGSTGLPIIQTLEVGVAQEMFVGVSGIIIGQSIESDGSEQISVGSVGVEIQIVFETELAQPFTIGSGDIPITQTNEVDLALEILVGPSSILLEITYELSTSNQILVGGGSVALLQALESEEAFALIVGPASATIEEAIEIDIAEDFYINSVLQHVLETNTAQVIAVGPVDIEITQTSSVETAGNMTVGVPIPQLSYALEYSQTLSFTASPSPVIIIEVSETDISNTIAVGEMYPLLLQVVETDISLSMIFERQTRYYLSCYATKEPKMVLYI